MQYAPVQNKLHRGVFFMMHVGSGLFHAGEVLAIDIDVLNFLCLHSIVRLDDRLGQGWGNIAFEHDCILSDTHIADAFKGEVLCLDTEVIKNCLNIVA